MRLSQIKKAFMIPDSFKRVVDDDGVILHKVNGRFTIVEAKDTGDDPAISFLSGSEFWYAWYCGVKDAFESMEDRG
jgi:hypothetical protein